VVTALHVWQTGARLWPGLRDLCPWVPAGRITSNPLLTRAYARSRFARAVQHSTAVADGCAARRLLYARPVPSAGVLFRHPGCRRSRGHAHRRAGTTPPTGYAATWRSTPRSSRRRCSPTPLRRASPSARCTTAHQTPLAFGSGVFCLCGCRCGWRALGMPGGASARAHGPHRRQQWPVQRTPDQKRSADRPWVFSSPWLSSATCYRKRRKTMPRPASRPPQRSPQHPRS